MELVVMLFVGAVILVALIKLPELMGPRCKCSRGKVGRPVGSKNKPGHAAGRPKGDQK